MAETVQGQAFRLVAEDPAFARLAAEIRAAGGTVVTNARDAWPIVALVVGDRSSERAQRAVQETEFSGGTVLSPEDFRARYDLTPTAAVEQDSFEL